MVRFFASQAGSDYLTPIYRKHLNTRHFAGFKKMTLSIVYHISSGNPNTRHLLHVCLMIICGKVMCIGLLSLMSIVSLRTKLVPG